MAVELNFNKLLSKLYPTRTKDGRVPIKIKFTNDQYSQVHVWFEGREFPEYYDKRGRMINDPKSEGDRLVCIHPGHKAQLDK